MYATKQLTKGKNMEEDLPLREKIVLNIYDYPKSVIKQATEENTQVGIHAMQLFDKFITLRINDAMKKHEKDRMDKTKPWHEDFKVFTHKELNAVIGNCFELAENLRVGCDIDLDARLNQLKDVMTRKARHIILPTANMVKDSTLKGEVPGLHDQ